jgi:DDE domain
MIEQDHRTVKKRTWLAKGYHTFQSAWRTLEGIEAVNMIRKGRVKWVAKGDARTQARFVEKLFGIAASRKFSPYRSIPLSIPAHSNFATEPGSTDPRRMVRQPSSNGRLDDLLALGRECEASGRGISG